jgi:prolyl 4-hydroxylase
LPDRCAIQKIRAMTGERPFDTAARAWLKRQLARNCAPREIADILFQQGFSVETVRKQMGASYPEEMVRTSDPFGPPPILRQPPRNLRRIDTPKLELYVLDDFLGAKLCEQVSALVRHYLKPSPLVGVHKTAELRTSSTCYLSDLRSPVVAETNQRISRTMGISSHYAESIQVQHYEVGQRFHKHWDYFLPDSAYQQYLPELGNRTWSFMVYLNEGMSGGGTRFHAIDQVFEPRKGQALFWNNLYPDRTPNPDTLHSGEPVTAGHKVIITQWFREYGAGQMYLE